MGLLTCFPHDHSLKTHTKAINKLSDAGMFFWDYGNAFLLEAQRAGQLLNTPTPTVYQYIHIHIYHSVHVRPVKRLVFWFL